MQLLLVSFYGGWRRNEHKLSASEVIFVKIVDFIIPNFSDPQYDVEFDHLLRGKEGMIGGRSKVQFSELTSYQVRYFYFVEVIQFQNCCDGAYFLDFVLNVCIVLFIELLK